MSNFALGFDDFRNLIEKSLSDIIDDDLSGNLTAFNSFDQDKRVKLVENKIKENFIKLFPDEDVEDFMSKLNIIAIVFHPIDNDGMGGYTSSVDNWGMFGNNEFKGWS